MKSKLFLVAVGFVFVSCGTSQGASEAKSEEATKKETTKRQSPTKTNAGKAAPTSK